MSEYGSINLTPIFQAMFDKLRNSFSSFGFEASPPSSHLPTSSSLGNPRVKLDPLDPIRHVLQRHNHPFILVGAHAQRWMGCSSDGGLLEILIRDEQYKCIVAAAIRARAFSSANAGGMPIYLVSERSHHLKVDGPLIEIPGLRPEVPVLIEEVYHPDIFKRRYGPALEVTSCSSCPLGRFGAAGLPMYIPTIARHTNALLDRLRVAPFERRLSIFGNCYTSNTTNVDWEAMEIRMLLVDLVRDLYLDKSPRSRLLDHVHCRNHDDLETLCNDFEREVVVVDLYDGYHLEFKQYSRIRVCFGDEEAYVQLVVDESDLETVGGALDAAGDQVAWAVAFLEKRIERSR